MGLTLQFPLFAVTALSFILVLPTSRLLSVVEAFTPVPPKISPATKLPNELYTWKADQQIRYQVDGPVDGEPVVLVHGLFVNSDHWRKTIKSLAKEGYRTYALDLWGCGYSSKPPRDSPIAQSVNGESRRFGVDAAAERIVRNAQLGTAGGKDTRTVDVELCHPLGSPYNFFTWSDLITDFCRDIVKSNSRVTLVSNSIGTISALQAVVDTPDLYNGVFVVSPNFRELHSAEVALPSLSMPFIRGIQQVLRERGQGLFDALAKPDTVKQILKEPYAVESAVDDTLVNVLLSPLLTEGASQVVFDTLSYSAGPLPEVQLGNFPQDKPVWVCYGLDDPWTPSGRVEALIGKSPVEKVVALSGVGHCPHDEAPEQVEPLLMSYLERIQELKDPVLASTGRELGRNQTTSTI